MIVLAIDTSESACSVALVKGRTALAVSIDDIGRGHAEHLLPQIEVLMAEAGIGYADIGRIAVATGPGTFTGLRIGLSVARGLALALGIPCIGLGVLPVLAAQAGGDGVVHALVMGRGGQAYHQSFDCKGEGLPVALSEAGAFDADVIEGVLRIAPGRMAGSGQALFEGKVPSELSSPIRGLDPVVLGRLAAELDPMAHRPEPCYLRDADAAKARRLLPVAP